MPVFSVSFDISKLKSGAQDAVSVVEKVTESTEGAENALIDMGEAGANAGKKTSAAMRDAAKESEKAATEIRASAKSVGTTGAKAGEELSSSIKSAAKNVLALVDAYKAVEAAMSFAQTGVKTNASFEQSKIGIASVIASVNQLEDAQGRLLKGPENEVTCGSLPSI